MSQMRGRISRQNLRLEMVDASPEPELAALEK